MLKSSMNVTFGGAVIAAGGLIVASTISAQALHVLGFAAVIVGSELSVGAYVTRSITRTNRPADAAFHQGAEMGYNKGWLEGRRAARPVVVHLDHNRESNAV